MLGRQYDGGKGFALINNNGLYKDISNYDSPFTVEELTRYNTYNFAIEQQKRFIYNIEPGITCCGDSSSIRQLFTILLDNAFKYSSDCGKIDFC